MPRGFVEKVTVTGADDSIRPEELIPIAKEFPFVEFGILLSKKQTGAKRFPSLKWLQELNSNVWCQYPLWLKNRRMNLAGHLCGRWVRDLCLGNTDFLRQFGFNWGMFDRLQFNFHAEPHEVDYEKFALALQRGLRSVLAGRQSFIFQMDRVNDEMFHRLKNQEDRGVFVSPLFDASGGAGILPRQWPRQISGRYCGYAGGLGPENVQQELERISKVATGLIWIDAETRLRSENDMVFDLEKVRLFLEASKPWVVD